MKVIAVLIVIHLMAYSFAEAQTAGETSQPDVKTLPESSKDVFEPVTNSQADACKNILPQIEAKYQEIEQKYRSLEVGTQASQESYLVSFNQMTEVLFQMTEARELETQKISQGRNALREALIRFDQNKNPENSGALQEQYLNLTMLLYASMMDSQKTLETLKSRLSQIESTRTQYLNSQKEVESLDYERLALEAKLISLKIKCQPLRHY